MIEFFIGSSLGFWVGSKFTEFAFTEAVAFFGISFVKVVRHLFGNDEGFGVVNGNECADCFVKGLGVSRSSERSRRAADRNIKFRFIYTD